MQHLKTTLLAWPIITVAAMLISFLTKELAAEFFDIALKSQDSVLLIRRIPYWSSLFLKIVTMVVVVAPLLEEAIFRFLFWKLPDPKRVWLAAIPSSILFTAAHYFQNPWPDNAFIALFFFGMAQCWLYKRTGFLWCPILNHMLFNLTNLAFLLCLPEKYLVL